MTRCSAARFRPVADRADRRRGARLAAAQSPRRARYLFLRRRCGRHLARCGAHVPADPLAADRAHRRHHGRPADRHPGHGERHGGVRILHPAPIAGVPGGGRSGAVGRHCRYRSLHRRVGWPRSDRPGVALAEAAGAISARAIRQRHRIDGRHADRDCRGELPLGDRVPRFLGQDAADHRPPANSSSPNRWSTGSATV